MQSQLSILRSRLDALKQKRAIVRWGSAVCLPLAIVLWLLVAAFLCDWSLNLPVGLRAIMLLAWCLGGLWAVRKYAWPLVKVSESTEDMALIVEREHNIDTDLVAALQFDGPKSASWGSSQLQKAIVDYVAEFSPGLDVIKGFSYEPLPRRALALGVTLLALFGTAVVFPGHVSAFWNRFLLGTAHYPTKTRIQQIVINDREVPVLVKGGVNQVRLPYGEKITVRVTCGGVLPTEAMAKLSGIGTDSQNTISLAATETGGADQTTGSTAGTVAFGGVIENVADSFRLRFQCGDALSDPTEVIIVPLPLVDLAWDIEPPKYAASSAKPGDVDAGSRQVSVIEGSTARLKLVCTNKTLKSAAIKVGEESIPLKVEAGKEGTGQAATSSICTLPTGTPFESIRTALKYEVQVVDQDGLSLDTPLTGQFRLKADRTPRVVASAVTRQVLPTAQPKLDFAAGDDFGVAKIVAIVNISREDGRTSQHEVVAKVIPASDQPQTLLKGQVTVPLSGFELVKGDEVKVSLEVTDWRGDLPGQKGFGESVTFSVTDLNGILTQTGEEDKKSAKQLDEILRRELGIGGERK